MTDVVKKTNDLPAYLQVKDDLGVENIESSDVVIPRIKICQSTSTQIKEEVQGIKDGDIYNSLTKEVYGDTINLVILLYWKSTIWFTDDFKLIGTIYKDIATGEEIQLGNDIKHCLEHKNEGIDAFNYMVLTDKELGQAIKTKSIQFPSIFSCLSAAMGNARQLNGKLKTNSLDRIPIYAQVVTVKTQLKKFSKGQAFMPTFSYPRYVNEQEMVFLKEFHAKCKDLQKRADVHVEEETVPAEEKPKDKDTPLF